MNRTSIEWVVNPDGSQGFTWNPTTGCKPCATGCLHCFAKANMKRWQPKRAFTDVQCHAERLDAPLKRRKPATIFVNSMSDLLHEDVPFEFIDEVFAVMAQCPQHRFIVLTKRHESMREYTAKRSIVPGGPLGGAIPYKTSCDDVYRIVRKTLLDAPLIWPLPNVILGYSASTQADLAAGIGDLLNTPAACRMLSLEPLIEHVGVTNQPWWDNRYTWLAQRVIGHTRPPVDWIIVGAESGSGRRLCDIKWVRSIVRQCDEANVPCFVKQIHINGKVSHDPAEWPEDLRNVRQYPALLER